MSTYATFESMHGRKSTIEELIALLRPFSRESVLYLCFVIGAILKMWDPDECPDSEYALLIRSTFEWLRADWYCFSARTNDPEYVFHRRQLLFIAKLAVQHCSSIGFDVLRNEPGIFGTICLMANDHFHFGLTKGNNLTLGVLDRDRIARVLAEFVVVQEYGGIYAVHSTARFHRMYRLHVPALNLHPQYVDIASKFRDITQIELSDYQAIAFGLFARCANIDRGALQANAWVALVRPENFVTTALGPELIQKFLSEVSMTPDEARDAITHRDTGANDFTAFRNRPMILEPNGMLAVDIAFLLDKPASGPFWRVNFESRETGDRLRIFWGSVFESYVNEQFSAAPETAGRITVPNPNDPQNESKEICDLLLFQDGTLVIAEFKSCMFRAEAKYSGDYQALVKDIERNLVRDQGKQKKKGVEQLADAIKFLFDSKPSLSTIDQIDLTQVRVVYPLIVTLDQIGQVVLMSTLLNTYFDQMIDRTRIGKIEIRPVFCIDVESLEDVLPFTDVYPLHRFLQNWLDNDPRLQSTLIHHFPTTLPHRPNQILAEEQRLMSEATGRRLFPAEFRQAS
jgi:hypothetical protein